MGIPLTVGGIIYDFPVTNSELWGTSVTDWAEAVSAQLNTVTVPGDIGPVTLVNIANNQASPVNVPSFVLDPALIRSGTAEYYVWRLTTGPSSELSEAGIFTFLYNDSSGTWTFSQQGNNIRASGVTFSVTNLGQVQYTSTNLTNTTYTGKMKFRLRVLQKT